MKKILKVTFALMLVLMISAPLMGCGSKTLKMGTNAAFPPFEYKEANGFAGIDIELAEAIGKKLGREVEIVDMEFDSLIPAVNSGKVDFVAAGMTVTPDREKEVDFTMDYYKATQVIVVKKDNTEIATKDDLKGKTLGAQKGTTGESLAKEIEDATVDGYATALEAVMDLKNGKIDAVVLDFDPAKSFEAQNDDIKVIESQFEDEYYAIAVKKGNTELLDQLNDALKEIIDSDQLKEIVDKYTTK
ncbi:MAG: basic amino acid ABC transporter substrate-binding protein [Clostridia bacterium]|jgi:ABC-type amino acid transport substrate-binding protein